MHHRTFSSVAAPPERPLPLWILYPLFFTLLYASHYTLLRLPFFWDEAGYYIPAALDFLQTGSLIPHSTLTNAHPPLPSLFLASWWHFAGYVISGTRTFILLFAAAALLAVFRLARTLAGTPAAVAATLLTAIYPVWFVQSTLAHADIFAAAFTLWALSFYFAPIPNRNAVAALFSLAALSKETAIVTPLALTSWEIWLYVRHRQRPTWLPALLAPILPLVLWYSYHHHETGFTFGNPEFLRYNATANLTPLRLLLSLWHRVVHLAFHMGLYVPLLCTIAVLILKPASTPKPGAPRLASETWDGPPPLSTPTLQAIAVIVAANALAFSILGGALLTRYLLPLYPLLFLVAVTLWQRWRAWPWLVLLSAASFAAALFLNPPYPFAPEDNLTYRDFIVLHQQAASFVETHYPGATVLTAWPATTELEHPQLGYVHHPLKVTPIDNFDPQHIAQAAADPGAYDTALIFSTKWVPPASLDLSRASRQNDTRYFDFHADLSPTQVALALHGDIVWQRQHHGEWAAVLRFPRSNDAQLRLP